MAETCVGAFDARRSPYYIISPGSGHPIDASHSNNGESARRSIGYCDPLCIRDTPLYNERHEPLDVLTTDLSD